MKYLITATFEMDGHSSAEVMICENATTRTSYLHYYTTKKQTRTIQQNTRLKKRMVLQQCMESGSGEVVYKYSPFQNI